MTPLVSVCVPNLNTRPFLPERFETIVSQTYPNCEFLVYDSYSDDGAWEYINKVAASEPRMRVWQGPRKGVYEGFNECIRKASGKYVYIATSDDTMPLDCLEKLVDALESHPECDVAHCRLREIDELGRDKEDWWSTRSTFAHSSGELLRRPHIRMAPFDGLLHLFGSSVYISITQLLLRRSLFDRIGLFESKWGSVGDFSWNMRAGLIANTFHVPDTWGGWRMHAGQATSGASIGTAEHSMKIRRMIEDALSHFEKNMAPHLRRPLAQIRDFCEFHEDRDQWHNSLERKILIVRQVLRGSEAARSYLNAKLCRSHMRPWREVGPELVRHWLEDAGAGPVLVLSNS